MLFPPIPDGPGFRQLNDFLDNSVIFLTFCLVDTIVHILRAIGRLVGITTTSNLVDIPELACFRLRRTGHTGPTYGTYGSSSAR